jgi:lysozyme
MMGINDLTYSRNGLALTEQYEGCRLTAYQDQVGVWTVGYGHTGADVTPGLTITQAEAEALLAKDVLAAARCVNTMVKLRLTQGEFDALVDFVFNLGPGNFLRSTLLTALNAGDLTRAAAQFECWDRAGGVIVAGLLRRRKAELGLFQDQA